MDYVNQDLNRLYARLGLQQQIPYVSSGNVFFNGELEMDIVCILGIYFPSKRQVPIDVAVTAHQVPNCIQLEQCEQSFLLKETLNLQNLEPFNYQASALATWLCCLTVLVPT